jgi:5-methylcytosine-specific restriction enzyme A
VSPYRLCAEAGCPDPAVIKGRCRRHASAERKSNRSVNDRFYSSRPWRYTRNRYLREHPLCERCGRIADSVHHVQAIEDGGARRDPENLQALCRPCHSSVHRGGGGS